MRRLTTGERVGVDAEATVTLRFAVFDDAPDLFRLAQLDSAEPLADPILVAEVSGQMTAALSLSQDRVIADPFVLTGATVELLRARGRQLRGPERRWRLRSVWRLPRVWANVNGGLGKGRLQGR